MLQPTALPEALARWHYTPDEWRDFTENEREPKGFVSSDALTTYFCFIIAAAAVTVIVGAILGGVRGAGIAVMIAVVLCSPFLLIGAIRKFLRSSARQGLEARVGEVWITHDGVCTNGMWFGWGAREPAWRLRVVRRQAVSTTAGKTIEVLEFKCVGKVRLRGSDIPVDKKWRVPVPAGKEAEADAVITRLLAARHSPPAGAGDVGSGGLNHLYGHAFAGDVCRRCGSTVEAVSSFKWQCDE